MKAGLVAAVLLALNPSAPVPAARWRCRFCRVALSGYDAAVSGCMAHPPNRCRYGRIGKTAHGPCAVPVDAVEAIGANATIARSGA